MKINTPDHLTDIYKKIRIQRIYDNHDEGSQQGNDHYAYRIRQPDKPVVYVAKQSRKNNNNGNSMIEVHKPKINNPDKVNSRGWIIDQ
jgi:hypothetical protein